MAKLSYDEWVGQQREPTYPIYFISGKHHWRKEFFRGLKDLYRSEGKIVSEGLEKSLKEIRYRPLRGKKHLLMYDTLNKSIKKRDIELIKEYILRKPSKHGVFILAIKDWKDKKLIKKNFRYLDKSKVIKFFDLDYPGKNFLEDYIKHNIKEYNLKFDCKNTEKYFIRRVSSSSEDVLDSIQVLKSFDKVIDKEMVKAYTEDNSKYNYNRLFDSVVLLNRVKVPYIAYNDLLESGRRSSTIMINMLDYMKLLYQAKYLRMKGILRHNDIIDRRKRIYDEGEVQFKVPNIWNESGYMINKLIEQSSKVSLQEILRMILVLESIIVRDNEGKLGYIDSVDAYMVFNKILGRVKEG